MTESKPIKNKHTAYDLKQMQSLPLEGKIIMTKQRIKIWYEHWEGQVYVSFSGGKDSTVLKHMIDSMYDDVPAVFVNTGLEYPEIQNFVRSVKAGEYECFNNDVEMLRPEMRFDEVINKYGYPVISKDISSKLESAIRTPNGKTMQRFVKGSEYHKKYGDTWLLDRYSYLIKAPFKISSKCCNVMKKKPAKQYEKQTGRKAFIGTMAEESKLRLQKWLQNGCNAFQNNRPISQPMSFWTDQDVFEYIVKYNVPYSSIYGSIVEDGQVEGQMYMDGYHDKLCTTGAKRTGCMFCMFGAHMENEPNRFQRMKETHPKQYEYCMNELELKEVLDYIGVKYD